MWSIGVVLYAVLCGEVPFATPDEQLRERDARPFLTEIVMDHPRWAEVSDTCKDVVRWMLRPDPISRASTTECLEAIHALLDYHEVMERREQALARFTATSSKNRVRDFRYRLYNTAVGSSIENIFSV